VKFLNSTREPEKSVLSVSRQLWYITASLPCKDKAEDGCADDYCEDCAEDEAEDVAAVTGAGIHDGINGEIEED
jgi:hypothetical protein